MSCKFCETFNFTEVAVKDNNIHTAGGSNRFTDPGWAERGFELFKHCPMCGCNLLYSDAPAATPTAYTTNAEEVLVAVDEYGWRIPFAIDDSDSVMTEEEYYIISQLRADCGVSFQLAKDAYRYAENHDGNYDMMVAYIKAKSFAATTDSMPFDKRVEMFMSK